MSNQDNDWRVAVGPDDWVTLKTPEDAVKLGRYIASLVADLGVYKAERDRLAIEVEHLKTKPTLADQYATYAALAAENERLSRMFAELETPYLSNNLIDSAYAEKLKALAAENERLRKAGDRLAFHAQEDGTGWELHDAAMVWLAAKEGRDAK